MSCHLPPFLLSLTSSISRGFFNPSNSESVIAIDNCRIQAQFVLIQYCISDQTSYEITSPKFGPCRRISSLELEFNNTFHSNTSTIFSHSKTQTSSASHMNKIRRSEGDSRRLSNAVNMIGKQRKNTSLKRWAVVLLAETRVVCTVGNKGVCGRQKYSGSKFWYSIYGWNLKSR